MMFEVAKLAVAIALPFGLMRELRHTSFDNVHWRESHTPR